MRTLILHLTNGETREWETEFGEATTGEAIRNIRNSCIEYGFFGKGKLLSSPTFAVCTDKSLVNLNHVVWMEEKKV